MTVYNCVPEDLLKDEARHFVSSFFINEKKRSLHRLTKVRRARDP